MAKAVRYIRRLVRDGSMRPDAPLADDRDYALRMKVAHAVSGGYDSTARTIPRATRRLVVERDMGSCVICGAPGEEIDHVDGSSNEPVNLRILCRVCHREMTSAGLSSDLAPEQDTVWRDLMRRAFSSDPLRPCDQPDWSVTWRQWVKEHRIIAPAPGAE